MRARNHYHVPANVPPSWLYQLAYNDPDVCEIHADMVSDYAIDV